MNDITTELFKGLQNGSNISDAVNELLRQEVETAVNTLLQQELTTFLDYEKWDPIGYNTGDSRNGSYRRSLDTKFGKITVTIPRDRNGEFKQHTVPRYQRNDGSLEDMVIQLYRRGITTAEIADLIEKMYGSYYTPQTISNMTKMTEELVQKFHGRNLNRRYSVIYADATYINVRRDSVAKEALHILIGINDEGIKELLDYRLYPSESAENYRELLKDIKDRGVKEVLLFISDGLKELRNVFLEEYPCSSHQACWVHIGRAVGRNIRRKDSTSIYADLKKIYRAGTEEESRAEYESFTEKYGKQYPKAVKVLKNCPSLFTFYSFPEAIRKSIYTSNPIESFNKQLKRDIKRKEQFPNEDSLDRFTCVKAIDYNRRSAAHAMKGFKEAAYELDQLFGKRYGNESREFTQNS
ncbi:MAG: IS256 family transposase [Solobacterium sp.]|nr:IS256 family transposase [Solobacterium sp.]